MTLDSAFFLHSPYIKISVTTLKQSTSLSSFVLLRVSSVAKSKQFCLQDDLGVSETSLTSEVEAYVDNLERNLTSLPKISREKSWSAIPSPTSRQVPKAGGDARQPSPADRDPPTATSFITSHPHHLSMIVESPAELTQQLPAFGFHQPKSVPTFPQT